MKNEKGLIMNMTRQQAPGMDSKAVGTPDQTSGRDEMKHPKFKKTTVDKREMIETNTRDKKVYEPPCIFAEIALASDGTILQGSVGDNVTGVQTTGQGVDDYNSNPGGDFTVNWGE